MDFYQAFRARLLAAAPLTALVGNRIDWDERSQGKPLPAITLQIVSDGDEQTMDGPQALRSPRVQVDIWSDSRASTAAIWPQIVAAAQSAALVGGIQFERAFVDARRDSSERPEAGGTVFRTSLDLLVWHAPA